MHLKIKQLKLNRFLLIMLALTSMIIAVTATAGFWRRGEATSGPERSTVVVQSPNRSNGKPDLTLLPIQIREAGFARRDLKGEAGNFELLIINASGQLNLTLKLQREHGEEVQSFPTQRSKNTRKKFHLGPGVYVLSVVEHSDWTCRLTITKP